MESVNRIVAEIHEALEADREQKLSDAQSRRRDQRERRIEKFRSAVEEDEKRQRVEFENRLRIENSRVKNQKNVDSLRGQWEGFQEVVKEAKARLLEFSKGPEYPELQKKLIAEGLIKLNETKVTLVVRECDVEITKSVLDAAKELAKAKTQKEMQVKIADKRFLDPEPICAGGVFLFAQNGRIRVSNVLNDRLKLASDGLLPNIRHLVIPKE